MPTVLVRKEPDIKTSAWRRSRSSTTQFSTSCLLARRLVERGVRFVQIFHASWDQHSNLDVELGQKNCRDKWPINRSRRSSKTLKQRGLLGLDTLIVWAGEFGRTPLGEKTGWELEVPSPVAIIIRRLTACGWPAAA